MPRDLKSVLTNRIAMIKILFLRFQERYGDQPAFEKLLQTVRQALQGLQPALYILGGDIPEDTIKLAESVLGPHAAETMEVCPNAGWFVAEIDSLIQQTNYELQPGSEYATYFITPSWLREEDLETIRTSFERIAETFCSRINVFDNCGKIVSNPFGL